MLGFLPFFRREVVSPRREDLVRAGEARENEARAKRVVSALPITTTGMDKSRSQLVGPARRGTKKQTGAPAMQGSIIAASSIIWSKIVCM